MFGDDLHKWYIPQSSIENRYMFVPFSVTDEIVFQKKLYKIRVEIPPIVIIYEYDLLSKRSIDETDEISNRKQNE